MIRLTFGKYKFLTFDEIFLKDKQYLEWLNTQPWYQIKCKESRKELSDFLSDKKENIIINPDSIIIYTDGACKNNGSKTKLVLAGVGVHFSLRNKIQMDDISFKLDIGEPTNNKAELLAILFALQECHKNNIFDHKIVMVKPTKY